jgi:hypothetical protein
MADLIVTRARVGVPRGGVTTVGATVSTLASEALDSDAIFWVLRALFVLIHGLPGVVSVLRLGDMGAAALGAV